MIPISLPSRQPPDWQRALQDAVCDPAELVALLRLGPQWLEPARAAARRFPLRVPRGFVARMRPGDPRDPLLLQVLPLGAELDELPGYRMDPVGDLASRAAPGLLFTSLSAGDTHTCGVETSGSIFCWGNNGSSRLGDATTTSSPVPVKVAEPAGG